MTIPAPPESERDARRFRRTGAGSRGRHGDADDDAIVTELYRLYRAPLMSYVLRLTAGDRPQAEDVVQETMLRAWRQASRLDLDEASLMPWLATVARRIVIDQGRRRRARPTETGDQMLENVPVADMTEGFAAEGGRGRGDAGAFRGTP